MVTLQTIPYEHSDISVIFEQDRRLPLVSLQLVFRDSGALAGEKPGLAKLASRLLGEGTRTMGSEAFFEALESRAVSLHASVGSETFVISLHALKSEFAFGLSMLRKLLADPNFTQEAFDRVQAQTIGALTQKQSDFDFVASNLLKSLLFEGTPRAYPSSGTVESVEEISLQIAAQFIREHLGQQNVILLLGGDLEPEEAGEIAREALSGLPSLHVPELGRIDARFAPAEKQLKAATDQAYLYFGAPYTMPYDSDEVYLGKVAAFVLGSSGFGSRLMEEIRVKRGLAYSAYANFHVGKTGSYFSGHLQTKLESAEEARQVVEKVVRDFIEGGMTEEELASAQQFLLGSEPLRNETLQQRMGNAFNDYYNGKPLGYRQEELAQIKAITAAQINRFIRTHTEIGKISFASVIR